MDEVDVARPDSKAQVRFVGVLIQHRHRDNPEIILHEIRGSVCGKLSALGEHLIRAGIIDPAGV